MRAVDHAVETLYSSYQHPVSASQAAAALRLLATHLAASLDATRLDERLQCQTAAWMSVQGIAYAGLGLSHALGHQIGPRWNVAHGVTSCITLPHAMRALAANLSRPLRRHRRGARHSVRRGEPRACAAGVRRRRGRAGRASSGSRRRSPRSACGATSSEA
jgi:alcohol dehydrogenase class IV